MPNYFSKITREKFAACALVAFIGFLLIATISQADSTSNVNVGFAQGGSELYVKTGGSINVRSVSLFQLPVVIADIGTASSSAGGNGYVAAPFAGTVSSVVCNANAQAVNGPTVLAAQINGVAITNGSLTVTSTASAYELFTATPTAANTVAAGDMIRIGSDGTTTATPVGTCRVFITP